MLIIYWILSIWREDNNCNSCPLTRHCLEHPRAVSVENGDMFYPGDFGAPRYNKRICSHVNYGFDIAPGVPNTWCVSLVPCVFVPPPGHCCWRKSEPLLQQVGHGRRPRCSSWYFCCPRGRGAGSLHRNIYDFIKEWIIKSQWGPANCHLEMYIYFNYK